MKKFIQASACVLMAQLVTGCADKCKIDPPASVVGTNKEASAKVAANTLSTAISGGEVSGSYRNTVNNTYQTVGQDDIAFYLLMQAYNCESKRGHATAATEILALARQELARRHDATPQPTAVAVTSTALTPTETKVLKNSSPTLKAEVKKMIAKPKTVSTSKKPATKKAAKPASSPSPSPSA
jgi:hypothetical protein